MSAFRGALTLVLAFGAAAAEDLPLGAWVGADDAAHTLLVEPDRAARHDGEGDPRFWRLDHLPEFDDVLARISHEHLLRPRLAPSWLR